MAGLVLGAAAALAFLVAARFLYDGLSGQKRFTTWFEFGLYCLFPAVLAVLLFASLWLRPLPKLRLLMVGIAVTFGVYAVELVLVASQRSQLMLMSSLDGQPFLRPVMTILSDSRTKAQDAAALAKKFAVDIDTRTSAEVIADLHRQGDDAIRIVTATNHLLTTQADGRISSVIKIDGREVLPLATISGRTTLMCNENGQWITYKSDSRGFNNPERVWQSGQVDIAALGDSFTQGYCVAGGKSFVDLIRQHDAATLNLGIAGDGPLMMLATLTEYLPRLAPKVVLWFYYEGNDLTDLQTERKSALLSSYLRDDFVQPALTRQADVDRAIVAELPRLAAVEEKNARARAQPSLFYSAFAFAKLTSLRERLAIVGDMDPAAIALATDFEQPNMRVFQETLRQAKRRVAAWNGQLYFVYLPEWARYTRYSSWGKNQRDEVLKLVDSLGIPTIDIDPVFRAHGDPLSLFPFRSSGHYAESGHRLVADEVVRHLQTAGRINLH